MLVSKGCRVFLADRDIEGASSFASSLNTKEKVAHAHQVEVTSWDQQAAAFSAAVKEFGRIDYVYPIAGIGERVWTPNRPDKKEGFKKPDLTVLDVDVTGVLYTVSLALQQFRRQDVVGGFRGKSKQAFISADL
jgi:NADP-dependent 3-hydroxy acid dehydrogenase YdfG